MRIGREIIIVAGILAFLLVFYLLNPTNESLLRLLEISGILLVTFLAFLASKKLKPNLRYKVTLLVSLVSAMVVGYATREYSISKYFLIFLVLILLIPSPYLLKLVRFEPKDRLSGGDLLKIIIIV